VNAVLANLTMTYDRAVPLIHDQTRYIFKKPSIEPMMPFILGKRIKKLYFSK